MTNVPNEVRNMLDDLISQFHRDERKAIAAAALKNPVAHKDTNILVKAQYRYYEVKAMKGCTHRFCYSKYKNVAGYYLSFTETLGKHNGKRSNFIGWKTKKEAMQYCLMRLKDAQKPKEARMFVLPKVD